jgi:four helix bundle protein
VGEKNDLSERLLDFAASCIKLTVRLNRTAAGKHIAIQLMRSATSSGANYEEACGAESRADFIHKLQLVLKELKESLY